MTQTLDTRALNLLLAKIIQEETRQIENLPQATEWADFRERVGTLKAFKLVRELCNDVERDLYGSPDRKKA